MAQLNAPPATTRPYLARGFSAFGVVLVATFPALGLTVLSPGLFSSRQASEQASAPAPEVAVSCSPLTVDAPTTLARMKAPALGSRLQTSGEGNAPAEEKALADSKERQQAALAATVRIVNRSGGAEGSGVIMGKNGPLVYILTAHHLVAHAKNLEIETFSTTSYPKPQRLYRSAHIVAEAGDTRDLALIRLTTNDRTPDALALCPARLVPSEKDFQVLTVGCSEGQEPTCLVDQVAGKKLVHREAADNPVPFWEVDRKHVEGRSGGPMVDKAGYLLGVCSGTNREKTYFCHTDTIRAFLKESGLDPLP